MATIKSYTDSEQSKKLAEILPLESADMSWVSNGLGKPFARTIPIKGDPEELCGCWSLAALISILPQSIKFKGDNYYLRFMKEYIEYANDEISITGRCLHTTGNDNLVDACYEMIIKLNGLNLL